MKEAIGSIPLYNFIIIFIVITFGFLSATLSYMKAFKVNSNIAKQLERYEGYNNNSKTEINNILSTIGYRKAGTVKCPKKGGITGVNLNTNYPICIYESKPNENNYFRNVHLNQLHRQIQIPFNIGCIDNVDNAARFILNQKRFINLGMVLNYNIVKIVSKKVVIIHERSNWY